MFMGNRLKFLRERAGWTHDEAAAQMGMSRGGFIKIERGENNLTSETIARAARVFGVSEAEILSEAISPEFLIAPLEDAFRLLGATPEQIAALTPLVLSTASTLQSRATMNPDASGKSN
jgi:transcriptional regulator with XRE-family HTH domain